MSVINDFKDLKIWQKGMEIAEQCYFLTNKATGNRQQGTGRNNLFHTPTK